MQQFNKIFYFLLVFTIIQGCAGGGGVEEELIAYPSEPDEPRYYYQETLFHSGNIVQESEDDLIQRLLVGRSRKLEGFGKPGDIIVVEGVIYLTDSVGARVLVLDRKGNRIQEIQKMFSGFLRQPVSLALDENGNLYVADIALKTVVVFDSNGDFVKTIGDPELFDRPSSVAITPDGQFLYVTDTGGSRSPNHRINVFNGYTGELIKQFGSRGKEEGQFNLPKNIKLDGKGQLYVNDSGNFRIQVLNADTGEFIRELGSVGLGFGQFARPKGIDIDENGIIYVGDALLGNVQLFNEQGQLLMFIGQRRDQPGPGNFLLPSGISVDEDGRIFMVDQFFSKIDVFRPAHIGKYEGYFGIPDPDRTLEEVVDEDKAEERLNDENEEVIEEEVGEEPST